MIFRYSYLLPGIIFIWFIGTFLITYGISVSQKHVYPYFPYISDTGNWSVESCIFGLMLCLGALLLFMVIYTRYSQIKQLQTKYSFGKNVSKLNGIGMITGVIISIGVAVVGNFQETNMIVVHILGATMAFGGGMVYQIIQTLIAFKIYPKFGNKSTNILRVIFTVLTCISLILTSVFGAISFFQFKGDDVTKWGPEDDAYVLHLISTISEWTLCISTFCYVLCFTNEFKSISLSEPIITLNV